MTKACSRPNLSLPHSVWIRSEADLDRLAESGAIPVHNPAANLKLGSGLMALREMLTRGMTVALGVDGACSSDNQNMWDAVKLAALIHNLKDIDPKTWITAREAFEMGTNGGAAALLMRDKLGEFEGWHVGRHRLAGHAQRHARAHERCVWHADALRDGASVKHVIVNGEVVVRDRKVTLFDADALVAEFFDRVELLPFRQPMDAATKKDVADTWVFWWDVMKRVQKGE